MKTRTISNSEVLVIGLWKYNNCTGSYITPCVESDLLAKYETPLLKITQSLESLSLISIVISLVLNGFYVTSPTARIQRTAAFIMSFCFISALCSVGGAVAWTYNLPDKYYVYWSMGLTLLSAAICLLCGVLMIPDIRYYDYRGVERKAAEKRKKKRKKQVGKDTATLI